MSTFMFIMRLEEGIDPATVGDLSFTEMLAAMGRYNDELTEAGVFVSAEGLAPAEEGVVLDFGQTPPLVTDGPYGETKELFNGYWIVRTADRAEAIAWAAKAPLGPGVKLEIRRIPSLDEYDSEGKLTEGAL